MNIGSNSMHVDHAKEALKIEIEPLSETSSSSVFGQVEYLDEDVYECREEDGDKQSSNKVRQLLYVINEHILHFLE